MTLKKPVGIILIFYICMTFGRCKQWLVNCRRKDFDSYMKSDPLYLKRNCSLCADHFWRLRNHECKDKK